MSDDPHTPSRKTARLLRRRDATLAAGRSLGRGMSRMGHEAAGEIGRMSWGKRIALGLSTLVLLAVVVGTVGILALPDLDDYEANQQASLSFEDATGEPLMVRGELPSGYASLDRMPAYLPQAVMAIEDRRFREHGGIDPKSVGRAFVANAAAGEIVEGGSTISQQLIKISYLEPERTFRRKFQEALLTMQLENRYSKDEILEKYMNAVYMGSGARGFAAASRTYFDKPIEELTLAESAALAATIQLPSAVNLFSDPEALRSRAALAIQNMQADGVIDATEANAAIADITVMQPVRRDSPYAGWFGDEVVARTEGLADRFDNPGSVRTTLEPALQRRAEAAVQQALAGTTMQAALVALRPDGRVAALVGGRDYRDSQYNRVTQARRQPGSTFKAFVYMTALAEGMSPDDIVSDTPVEIDGYDPQNYGGKYHGEVTLRQALAHSYNAAAVNLATRIGIGKVAETAHVLGIDEDLSETPSLALGASEVSLLDLTEAYAGIATGRMPFKSHFVQGITAGDTGAYFPFNWPEPAPDPRAERLMAVREDLAGMLRSVVTDGTGKAAQAVPDAVGKTGTTQDFRDALFVGWGNGLVVGVWVGNDDNSPMDHVTGGGLPARIWAAFLSGDTSEASAGAPAPVKKAPAPTPDDRIASADPATPTPDTDESRFPDSAKSVKAPETTVDTVRSALESAQSGDVEAVQQVVIDLITQRGDTVRQVQSCNVSACDRAYRSFRASDCTFQPYGGGPRKLCTR